MPLLVLRGWMSALASPTTLRAFIHIILNTSLHCKTTSASRKDTTTYTQQLTIYSFIWAYAFRIVSYNRRVPETGDSATTASADMNEKLPHPFFLLRDPDRWIGRARHTRHHLQTPTYYSQSHQDSQILPPLLGDCVSRHATRPPIRYCRAGFNCKFPLVS